MEEAKFMNAAVKCWKFIDDNIKDQVNGEWHWGVDSNGKLMNQENKAGPWKAPYHNGRMCIELMKRA